MQSMEKGTHKAVQGIMPQHWSKRQLWKDLRFWAPHIWDLDIATSS